jgi:hypothetical protein
MDLKLIRRAAAFSVVAFLLSATAVFADTVPADGDAILPGNQAAIDLGAAGPGQTITRSISFSLVCAGTSHPAENATITIQPQSFQKPLDGTISAGSTTIGPIPASWTDTPSGCPSPQPVLAANGPVTVTLKTPTSAGIDYQYTIIFARLGASGLSGTTAINFTVDVVVNSPPTLSLPGPMPVEATSAAGATVLYNVGASDVEDDPDPSPSCSPASGSMFSMGPTTVVCSVTDSAGLTTTGSFVVTVRDSVGPSLTLPEDITAEATSASGAAVTYAASAADVVDPNPSFGCVPASGATFPLGTSTVSCTGTDNSGNTTTDTFDVTVQDTTAPALTVPADIDAEATSAAGAAVSYTASATDLVDPAPVVLCAPASGSTFPMGTTSVSCTATDANGNTSSGSFNVVVGDTSGPSLVLPGTITAEATGPSGAAASYSATASDTVDPAPVVVCSPASGSTFGLGTTSVHCTATDASGNQSAGSFSVVVGDSHGPSLGLPGTITAEATGPSGAGVSYSVTASDAVDPSPTVSCSPASGSTFGLGTTSVHCTATDASGNQSAGSFSVVVRDTTDPVLHNVPGDKSVTTANPSGAAVSWSSPTATDTVSGSVGVSCSPASGSTFPVGTTTVRCTAADDAGNSASDTFRVTVTFDSPTDVATVQWGEPITDGKLDANQGRTVPLKIRLFVNGVERTSGNASLSIVPCGGGTPYLLPMTFSGGRWTAKLDTSALAGGCYVATAIVDGLNAGSFELDVTGSAPAPTNGPGDKPPKDKPKK